MTSQVRQIGFSAPISALTWYQFTTVILTRPALRGAARCCVRCDLRVKYVAPPSAPGGGSPRLLKKRPARWVPGLTARHRQGPKEGLHAALPRCACCCLCAARVGGGGRATRWCSCLSLAASAASHHARTHTVASVARVRSERDRPTDGDVARDVHAQTMHGGAGLGRGSATFVGSFLGPWQGCGGAWATTSSLASCYWSVLVIVRTARLVGYMYMY